MKTLVWAGLGTNLSLLFQDLKTSIVYKGIVESGDMLWNYVFIVMRYVFSIMNSWVLWFFMG